MPSEPPRQSLPFEPKGDRKTAKKAALPTEQAPNAKTARPAASTTPTPAGGKATAGSIPEAVSRRMVKRMAFFSGIPTMMGIMSFFVSYFVVRLGVADLPNVAVLLVSMGCFGLGVIGLTYGALSASWDEETAGHWLGWGEFRLNAGRMVEAWRAAQDLRSER